MHVFAVRFPYNVTRWYSAASRVDVLHRFPQHDVEYLGKSKDYPHVDGTCPPVPPNSTYPNQVHDPYPYTNWDACPSTLHTL